MKPLDNPDYSRALIARTNSETAFKAISNGLPDWWGKMDTSVEAVNDIFTVSWGEPWYQFQVTEYYPNERITWKCIDANQIIKHLEDVEKEWVGTILYWRINELSSEEVEIRLTHQGLNSSLECYAFCSSTWDKFLMNRLKTYLEG